MEIAIAFSPCPNDTFIFDAMIHQKIETYGIVFKPIMMDVQALNESALNNEFPISKISYGVFNKLFSQYRILDSGSALGFGVGPMLIGNKEMESNEVMNEIVAIPGEHTTANLLFSSAYSNAKQKLFMRYDEIEEFVLQGKGLGVIIHENRFTYANKGLKKISDLGAMWEQKTGAPIPLGGIVASRQLNDDLAKTIEQLIRESIVYARSLYPDLPSFVTLNAQEMSEEVMRSHIDLYVNDYSLSLGEVGKKAIETLLQFQKAETPDFKAGLFL
jgi:1,4-dihydroxy-6-naphthoate synthase